METLTCLFVAVLCHVGVTGRISEMLLNFGLKTIAIVGLVPFFWTSLGDKCFETQN